MSGGNYQNVGRPSESFFYRLNLSCVHSFWFVIVLCPCFPCSTFEKNFSARLFDTLWVLNSAALCNQFSLRLAVKYANSICLWSPLSVIKYIFSCFTEWIVALSLFSFLCNLRPQKHNFISSSSLVDQTTRLMTPLNDLSHRNIIIKLRRLKAFWCHFSHSPSLATIYRH